MSTRDDDNVITKKGLEDLFKILEKQSLTTSRIYMNKADYDILSGKHCERCKGYYNKELDSHPLFDCDLEITRQIMES